MLLKCYCQYILFSTTKLFSFVFSQNLHFYSKKTIIIRKSFVYCIIKEIVLYKIKVNLQEIMFANYLYFFIHIFFF